MIRIIKLVIVIVLLIGATYGIVSSGDVSNYVGKTASELSNMTAGSTDIMNIKWWTDNPFEQLRALFYRVNEYRYSKDYSTNFQAAIDSGSVITVSPADTINLTAALNLKSNTWLRGSGPTSVIKTTKTQHDTGLSCIYIRNDSNIVISGITFMCDTNYIHAGEHDICISIGYNSKRIVITDCHFPYCVGDAIYMGGGGTISGGSATDIIISNCTMNGDTINTLNWPLPCSRNGISIVDGSRIIITNNVIKGFTGPGCIDIEPNPNHSPSQTVQNVIIANNHLYPRSRGIMVLGGSGNRRVSGITITGNHLYRTNYPGYDCGLYIFSDGIGNMRDITITDNIIDGYETHVGGYGGIYITSNCVNVRVHNNIIRRCGYFGIYAMGCSPGLEITNNLIYENYHRGLSGYSISTDCTSTYFDDPGFEDNSGSWVSYGTPTTQERSTTGKYAGSYGRKIVTDAANEGVYQILDTDIANDSLGYVMVGCYVWTAACNRGHVVVDVLGPEVKWRPPGISCLNNDSTWHYTAIYFKPTGTDTFVIKGSDSGITFYVDAVEAYHNIAHIGANISNNTFYNNGINNSVNMEGVRLEYLLACRINNNTSTTKKIVVADTATQYTGFFFKELGHCEILNNHSTGSIHNTDTEFHGLSYCDVGLTGIDDVWSSSSYEYPGMKYPYGKTLTIYQDSLLKSTTYSPMDLNGVAQGAWITAGHRVLGFSVILSDSMSEGTLKVCLFMGNDVGLYSSTVSTHYITLTGTKGGTRTGAIKFMASNYYHIPAPCFLSARIITDSDYKGAIGKSAVVNIVYE